jgi:hypothetical protein
VAEVPKAFGHHDASVETKMGPIFVSAELCNQQDMEVECVQGDQTVQ